MSALLPERNIEIKARIESENDFARKVEIAQNLTSTPGKVIVQKDVFFNSKSGRLKLRYLDEGRAQLVQYNRADVTGPRVSKFNRIDVDQPDVLEQILTLSNGSLGLLKKTRLLFLHNNTRIHLDRVENLGTFIEFEVCLAEDSSEEDGQRITKEMMTLFEIQEARLIACSYFDELRRITSLEQD